MGESTLGTKFTNKSQDKSLKIQAIQGIFWKKIDGNQLLVIVL